MAKQVTKAKQLKSDYMGDYCDECGDEKALCQCLQDLSTGLYIHESKIIALVEKWRRTSAIVFSEKSHYIYTSCADELEQLLEG